MKYLLILFFYFLSANAIGWEETNTGIYNEQRDEPNKMRRAILFFSKDAVVANVNSDVNKNFRKFLKNHAKYFIRSQITCDTSEMLGGYIYKEGIQKKREKETMRILDKYSDILDYSGSITTNLQIQGYPNKVNACEVVLVKNPIGEDTDQRGFVK